MITRPLSEYDFIVIDVETRGLRWWLPEEGIFGVALLTSNGESEYVDIREDEDFIPWLRTQSPRKIVNHNMKFDLHMLHAQGVTWPPELCECTMNRASLIDENLMHYSLDSLSKKYLKQEKVSDIYAALAKMFGGPATRTAQIKNLHRAPASLVAPYAIKDVLLAKELFLWQETEMEKQGLARIWALEKALFPVIFAMERTGVPVDVKMALEAQARLKKAIAEEQKILNSLAGFECNANPSGDMVKLFKPVQKGEGWVTKDGHFIESTETGRPSFDREALEGMNTPESRAILNIRDYAKCLGTFIEAGILEKQHNGRIYANINQCRGESGGTKTGRFSMTEPNLQQIPARNPEMAKIVRNIFKPDEGYIWACWDYEQFEYRMFSHYVDDPKINAVYAENPDFDFHQMVADLTGLPRNAPKSGGANAKQLNLSMIYDMGEASIAKALGLPLDPEPHSFLDMDGKTVTYFKAGKEAKHIIEMYHAAIPGVRKLAEKVKKVCWQRGYLRSIAGRHLRFPNHFGIHKAKARLCQGSSADCMKQKLIELHDLFQFTFPECRLYLSVHDEVNIGIPENHPEIDTIIAEVQYILEQYDGVESPIKINIPIRTDFGWGRSWAEASGKGA